MCNFSGMIKNVLPSLRQRAGPQRICSRQKSIRSGTARDSFSQTPHMRGKGVVHVFVPEKFGITPAHAGKRERVSRCACWTEGSPPRMRGKDVHQSESEEPHGITPAYAGKRAWPALEIDLSQDHPRTCGEKERLEITVRAIIGSPPHVRGKGLDRPLPDLRHGITPAYAGKSYTRPV